MMQGLINTTKATADGVQSKADSQLGKVVGYDKTTYTVKVQLYLDDGDGNPRITGWLPYKSPWVGNGWGIVCPPVDGTQVEVFATGGDLDNGHVVCAEYTDDDLPPTDCEQGEFLLLHKTGSKIKFKNDGTVEVVSQSDMTATVGGNLTANVTGDISLNGGGGSACKGVVQGDSVCAFTGMPHIQISNTVKATP